MPDFLKKPRVTAGTLSTGAVVLMLLGMVYDLAQRVARLEEARMFFHGPPTSDELKK